MAPARVLVVAPNHDLRQSLAFALEVEGYNVVATDVLPNGALVGPRYDCTVVDQRALTGPRHESIAFCIRSHPVVLLAPTALDWAAEWVAQVVETPANDGALTSAVQEALRTTQQSAVP
jgi:CheY-like chemotaxis protein